MGEVDRRCKVPLCPVAPPVTSGFRINSFRVLGTRENLNHDIYAQPNGPA